MIGNPNGDSREASRGSAASTGITRVGLAANGVIQEKAADDPVPEMTACQIDILQYYLKKNQNAPRPSEHPPVMGGKMSKRLGGIKGCKYKTSSWHLNRFPDADNIGSTV